MQIKTQNTNDFPKTNLKNSSLCQWGLKEKVILQHYWWEYKFVTLLKKTIGDSYKN